MYASRYGKLEVVRTLLENRANVDTQNTNVSDVNDRGNSSTYYCR